VTFDVITLFPSIIKSYLKESIIKRAIEKGLIKVNFYNLRDFCQNKQRPDGRPYGGGPGMVLKVEPLVKAVQYLKLKTDVILFSPSGKQFSNKMAAKMAKKHKRIILVCGRYEGIDNRVKKVFQDLGLKVQELSVGPYVLTGGELPALILIDAVSRQIPGVLGKQNSLEEKRLGVGVPLYTRPEVFVYKGKKYKVPKVLLSGNHKRIEQWRERHAQ